MKRTLTLFITVLLLLSACAPQPPSSVYESSSPQQGASENPSMPSASSAPSEPIITGAFTVVQFRQEGLVGDIYPGDGYRLLLELPDRVLIWIMGSLWWVSTADGSILSQQGMSLGHGVPDSAIRAEAWEGDGYDHRIFTVNSVIAADSSGKKEPLVYKLPQGLSDTLTDNEGRQIPFDLSPDGQTLAYTDAEGCWLADADGSNKRLVFATSGIGGIMGPDYPVDVMTPDYYQPRFFDNGKTLAAVVWDGTGNRRVLSLLRLETGQTRHYADIYDGLESSLHYFDDTILINRVQYIDTKDLSEETRSGRSGLTWDGEVFFHVDYPNAQGPYKVLKYTREDLENPSTLLEVQNGRLLFGGMTRTVSLWCVDSLRSLDALWSGDPFEEEAPQYLLVPYR